MDALAKLIVAVAQLVKALAWPGVVAFALHRLGTSLGAFLENMGETKFKGLGVEASIKQKNDIASKTLNAISSKRRSKPDATQPAAIEREMREAIAVANNVTTATAKRAISGKSVLWVDDKPEGNQSEIEVLRSFGLNVVTAISTKEGLSKYDSGQFSVVISDLSQGSEENAGFNLMGKLLERPFIPPVIIYSANISSVVRDQALNIGAYGITDRPDELFTLVLRALNIPYILN